MKEYGKNSILVVDDDTNDITALTDILKPDYIVYAAMNGQNAVKAAQKYIPDLILLDVIMPDMDGYAVITALKNHEKTRDIPIVFNVLSSPNIPSISQSSCDHNSLLAVLVESSVTMFISHSAILRASFDSLYFIISYSLDRNSSNNFI
jgi:CheY-like chemotaxis protein